MYLSIASKITLVVIALLFLINITLFIKNKPRSFFRLLGLPFLALLLTACDREEKWCYYKDSRGYIHKSVSVSSNIYEAERIIEFYKDFDPYNTEAQNRDLFAEGIIARMPAKRQIRVIRYYPKREVAKVIFRNNERIIARNDNRVVRTYLPVLLLHDSFPSVDTVRWITPTEQEKFRLIKDSLDR